MLEQVAGRRQQFAVRLRDGGRLLASGRVTRVVVDTRRVPLRRGRRCRGRQVRELRVVAVASNCGFRR
jgi:hypothetical protein